jgi:hypothetical protein
VNSPVLDKLNALVLLGFSDSDHDTKAMLHSNKFNLKPKRIAIRAKIK